MKNIDVRLFVIVSFFFVISSSSNAQWINNSTNLYTLDDNVGIGLDNPAARLHITTDGDIPATSANIRLDDSDATPDKRIDFYEGATSVGYLAHTFNDLFLVNDDADGNIIIDAENDISFQNSHNLMMTLKNDGKLGIGTAVPGDKLEVNSAVNVNSVSEIALKVDDDQAVWYDGDYFSWGQDGNWNYFNDNINIGNASSAPTADQALLINDGKNIEFNGSVEFPENQVAKCCQC